MTAVDHCATRSRRVDLARATRLTSCGGAGHLRNALLPPHAAAECHAAAPLRRVWRWRTCLLALGLALGLALRA